MKKFLCCTCILLLLTAAMGCNRETETEALAIITTPDEYCAEFVDADIIVGEDGNFYVNATHVSWVVEMDLQAATPVAVVKRTGITTQFEPWDATVLPVDTAIARHNSEEEVLIADSDGTHIPYLKYKSE